VVEQCEVKSVDTEGRGGTVQMPYAVVEASQVEKGDEEAGSPTRRRLHFSLTNQVTVFNGPFNWEAKLVSGSCESNDCVVELFG